MNQFSIEFLSPDQFFRGKWSPAENFGSTMEKFSIEFWSYSYKTVEEPFTMRQTMTKISPESLRRGDIVGGGREKISPGTKILWKIGSCQGPKFSAGD